VRDFYYSHDDANLQELIAACDEAMNWADANARWFDISTAPRDETPVLLYCPTAPDWDGYEAPRGLSQNILVGWCGFASHDGRSEANEWVCASVKSETFHGSELTGSWQEYEWTRCNPTHWRPLPPPPSNPPLPAPLERLGEVLRKVKGTT
jgi:hypothetical protein